MNKFEANISLFFITFFSAMQNIFLVWVPDSVSHFAFMCITNLLGFFMSLAFFFGELFRLDLNQVKQSMVLSVELIVFNLFMLTGVAGAGPTMTNALLSTDFVFISIITFLMYKSIPDRATLMGIIIVLSGVIIMADADFSGLLNWSVLYLIIANIAFALFIITTGIYSSSSNPSVIAMGQMFFCALFSFILWAIEAAFFGAEFSLPATPSFWGSVIYVSFFIRGLYGIVQTYVQRYITPLSTALIMGTETIMLMAVSPVLTAYLGTEPENITPLKVLGAFVMVFGILITEPEFVKLLVKLTGRMFHVKR